VSKIIEELDHQQTPLGELILRRRLLPTADNSEIFEVKLGEDYLMSSVCHVAEDALADLALAELGVGEFDIVVGGLGLGYTAAAALKHPTVRSLRVIELFDAVIAWHRLGLVPLGATLKADPRCRLAQGDFFKLAAADDGFDSGRRFHAVLLDIDHTPEFVLHPDHAAFYSSDGLRALTRHLHPGGLFGLWSNDPPDLTFVKLLESVFTSVCAHAVTFPHPLTQETTSNTVYLARDESAARHPGFEPRDSLP
jgi:spermidine synthase